ncbi:MAG: hypothetical protein IJ779_06555 [Ruminococcus sp.]|nr:hypothetical protein [Ruminococcus sp.]
MLFIRVCSAIIVFVTVGIVWYRRYLIDKKHTNMISLDVKNRLITKENYSPLDGSVLKLVKAEIIRRNIAYLLLTVAVFAAVTLLYALTRREVGTLYAAAVLAVFLLLFFAAKTVVELAELSSDRLIKVKAFVFRQRGFNEISVLYYDMIRMKYRVFPQKIVLRRKDEAELGSFVNLIAVKKKNRVKVIRILSF